VKGTVTRPVMAGDAGEIRGDDGKTYVFTLAQVRHNAVPQPGERVDFIGLGEDARDIHVEEKPDAVPPAAPPRPDHAAPPPAAVPMPGSAPRPVSEPAAPQLPQPKPPANPAGNLWTYFTDGLTKKYGEFNGRARRSEYWGYTLFWWVVTVILALIDLVILGLTTPTGGEPFWFFYLSILWQLGTLVPNIAIVVRRLHDLDMSGWLYLIKGVDMILPYVGTIIVFIFTLMDSKPGRNQHGPSPKYDQDEKVAYEFS